MPVREHKAGDYLKTPENIAAYLNVVFEDPDTDHEDLMIAFRNVADAYLVDVRSQCHACVSPRR